MDKIDEIRDKLVTIREELCHSHIGKEMYEIVNCGILLILSKSHMLIYGPHGTNKSRVIEDLFSRITGANNFVLSGSAYATVEDVMGPIKMSSLDHDVYERAMDGKLPRAHFGFMDEVLECQDALVKVLHPIMNERRVSCGDHWEKSPLISMFAATNVPVEDAVEGKAAFIDRWHLRFKVNYPDDPEIIKKIRALNRTERLHDIPKTTITLEELQLAQESVKKIMVDDSIDTTVCKIYKQCYSKGIQVSPRRLAQVDPILQASAWMSDHTEVDHADLAILQHCLWTQENHIEVITRILAAEAKSQVSQAKELANDVTKLKKEWDKTKKGDPERAKIIAQVQEKAEKLNQLSREYSASNRNPKDIDEAYEKAQIAHQKMIRESRR